MKVNKFGKEKKKHGQKTAEKEVRRVVPDQNTDLPNGRISDGLLYPTDIEIIYKKNANGSLVPYEIKAPIVPEETQNLIYRLKQPKKPLVLDEVPVFEPDHEADHDLKYAQQAAVEGKISHIFEGNKKLREADTEPIPFSCLSPFTQSYLRGNEIRHEEQTVKRTSEAAQFELSASIERRNVLEEKRLMVRDYVKWINRQIHVSMAVRDQTAQRAEKDRRRCEDLTQQRMELFEEQKKLMENRFRLRKMHRARKRWRTFMIEFRDHLGKSFFDIADFCGFYEMSQAVLELCTENKDKEKVQLDQALREAEVRPEEWTAEKAALEKLIIQSLGERDHLSNMLIELQNLNRFHKNNHESDKQEWQRLTERIDDITYSIQSSMGCSNSYLPTDYVQRLQIFERYLILSEIVEEKLIKVYGPLLIEHHAHPLRGLPKNYPLEKLDI